MRRRRRPSTLASGFLLLPSIVSSVLRRTPVVVTEVLRGREQGTWPHLTSAVFQCQGLVLSAKNARQMRAARVEPAWNPGIFVGALSVDERTGIFRRYPREPASDGVILRLWIAVDKCDIL